MQRDSKDVLVVTAPGSGAEVIPFLKTYVNLPMAIGFSIIYAKVSCQSATPADLCRRQVLTAPTAAAAGQCAVQ